MRNYSPREFQAFPTIRAVVQDARGIMYFGTRACVLEYDGVAWRKISLGSPTSTAQDVAIESGTGTVFVGGTDDLGYLQSAPDGGKTFVSLLERVPAEARGFKSIIRVFDTPEGIVFVAKTQIMRWHEGKFRIWKLPTAQTVTSAYAAGHVYVANADTGLLRLDNDDFVPAARDPDLNRRLILMVAARRDGSLLVATAKAGLFTLRGDGTSTPLTGTVNDFLKTKQVLFGSQLRDRSLVIGTASGGILLLDEDLALRERWDESSGLQNQTLWATCEDREGGLWLGLDVGVTRLERAIPVSVFDAVNGLKNQNVYDAARLGDTLYLAAASGLYRVVKADSATLSSARCERVPGTDGFFIEFCPVEQGLLVGGTTGVSLLDAAGNLQPVASYHLPSLCMLRSRAQPERVFVGNLSGLDTLRRDPGRGVWTHEGKVVGVDDQVRSVVEDAPGSLWLGTFSLGLLHLRFPPPSADGTLPAPEITSYFQRPGPLQGQPWAVATADRSGGLVVCTKKGMYQYDARTGDFAPAEIYGAPFADGTFQMTQMIDASERGFWIAGHGEHGNALAEEAGWMTAGRDGSGGSFRKLPAALTDKIGKIECIRPEDDGVVWFAGADGMARLDLRRWTEAAPPGAFATLLRRAFVTAGDDRDHDPQPISQGPIPYGLNSVHFDYAANRFAPGPAMRYQTRLSGFKENTWSDFSERAAADYVNLPEGSYTFEVRARDADGRFGEVAVRPFRILPPWQRTRWAYALYALAGMLGVIGIVWWRGRQLRRRNATLAMLVDARTSELRGREADLVRARDQAEAANRAKSAFLANMSHELRTPLNAILGYSQILLESGGLTSRDREQVAVIDQSGEHLLALINEVLDVAKIEAGKLTLNPSDGSLAQLLDEICATFRPRVAQRGLEYHDRRGPGLPDLVRTDIDRLRQVLFNLMSNAVKFTRTGSVSLEVCRVGENGTVRFAVADTGIGIAAGETRKIFTPFHQAGDRTFAAQGTGLGLAISQRLVALLGGEIQVESTPGQGSRFWFDLPIAAAMPGGGAAPVSEIDSGQNAMVGYEWPRQRILVVDDVEENRRILREMLSPLGFEIEEAASGTDCLERCAQRLPDAVLLDLRLGSEPDGFEVARTLRRRQTGKPPAIIAASASVFEESRQQAIDAGCDDFLSKPFRKTQLLTLLGRALGLSWRLARDSSFAPAPAAGALPSKEEIDAMLELSLRGDIAGIGQRLDALQAASSGEAVFVSELRPLVAAYQLDQLHEKLLWLKTHAKD